MTKNSKSFDFLPAITHRIREIFLKYFEEDLKGEDMQVYANKYSLYFGIVEISLIFRIQLYFPSKWHSNWGGGIFQWHSRAYISLLE